MATGALVAATAAVGAFSSFQQAQAANRFAGQQAAFGQQVQAGQVRATRIQARQIEAQSALEKQKTARQSHQIRSTLRVAAGESLGLGGTYEALVRQADFDEATNVEIISRNALMAQQSVFSRIQPLPPTPPQQNATLALILGGLGGARSGLSIGSSALSIQQNLRNPPRTGGTG